MEDLITKLFSWLEIDENAHIYATTLVRSHKKIELSRVDGRRVMEKLKKAGSYPYLKKKFKKKYNLTLFTTDSTSEIQRQLPELLGIFTLIIAQPSLLKILENKILLNDLKKEPKVNKNKKKPILSKKRSKTKNLHSKKLGKIRNKRNQKQTNLNKKEKETTKTKTKTTTRTRTTKEKEKIPDFLAYPKIENDYYVLPNSKETRKQTRLKETNFLPISIPISNDKITEKKKHSENPNSKQIEPQIEISTFFSSRPYLNGTNLVLFPRKSVLVADKKHKIGIFPLEIQETLIIKDLLYCLIGIEGTYITVVTKEEDEKIIRNKVSFEYDQTLDESLGHLTRQILPLCGDYYTVNRYLFDYFNYNYGKVNHSLCLAINGLLKDYYTTISKFEERLEKGGFTLQKLKRYLSPSLRTLNLIRILIEEIVELGAKGGMVINIISKHLELNGSDLHSRSLFLFLIEKSCQPYFQMLEKWLFEGIVEDPHEEFIIFENKRFKKQVLKKKYNYNYWEKKYTIRKFKKKIDIVKMEDYNKKKISIKKKKKEIGYIPFFLKKNTKKLLRAGKYLNVFRECGIKIHCPYIEKFTFSLNEQKIGIIINKIYNWSSEKLLKLLVEENQLFDHLESLKRYFLIGAGDWMSHFLDLALKELSKKIVEIVPNKLVSFLGIALQNSISKNDPLKDNLNCVLLPNNLINQLMGIINTLEKKKRKKKFDKDADEEDDEDEDYDGDYGEDDDDEYYDDDDDDDDGNETIIQKQIDSKFTGNKLFTTSLFQENLEPLDSNLNDKPKISLTSKISQQQPNITGIDTFALDYHVSFPLSLFINKKILTKYQIIFRHLFYCKKVENEICNAWKAQQRTKEIDFELVLLQSYALIHKMLHFIQNLQYYMHFEVLEQNWIKFQKKIKNGNLQNIDQLMQIHENYLNDCLKQCMLTNPKLLSSLTKILSTCQIFANHTTRLTQSLTITNREKLNIEDRVPNLSYFNTFSSLLNPKQSQNKFELIKKHRDKIKIEKENVKKFVNGQAFYGMVKNSENKFIQNLISLLINLQRYSNIDFDPQMSDFMTRLDYNSFYSNILNSKKLRFFEK
ncbi:gamma-tubulin complex component 2 [Anaeramoeba flamelloides]|uniref:Gamma-tubulin complex component 2 n=1 Tax=Anaeramoeba flamelloides TaxID=1746091 RepID=A0ABQ8YPE8_9EUKA|nr:gamma-tubulin complex component 2 [Anaeramoeba flamelloides]